MNKQEYSSKTNLMVLTISTFFCLSLWFSANAVKDQFTDLYSLESTDLGLYSIVTIIGFVVFGIFSSVINLPDIIRPRNLFVFSSFLGAIFNLLASLSPNFSFFLFFRFLTGGSIAGIYPIGMKLTASHYKEERGFAIGLMVSAVILGSGLPYIFNIFGSPNYVVITLISSVLSIVGGIFIFIFVSEGPYIGKELKFSLTNMKKIIKLKPFL